ncbi:putative LRR receptor-like serine/threonine-protein kinase MRH1-like [Capsicum annuum]|nr:putative LRR receptor-like serine/threonine-protein kinase MRH1-like [Capsicum annuum]
MESLHKNDTWDLVRLPKDKKIVRCKWVFKKKEGTLGVEYARYKVKLVAKGYSQVPGVDFIDVFSPVVKHSLIRALLVMREKIKVKANLSKKFEMKDLGATKKILGMEIMRDREKCKLYLSQKRYIEKVLHRYRRGKRAPQQADSLSTKKRERISYYEQLQATYDLSESNLIGSGSFGSVYKGILKSGTAVAVKVFNLQLDAVFKSFDTECEVLRSLRHRNHVKRETKHNDRCGMCFVISSLLVLSPVIHCDLTPSNVLLDEDMVSHLSDFGISKLHGEDQGDLYTKTLATLGYITPEYGLKGLVSTKCDIYSYGVMLLETFTRRKSNEFEGALSLKQWVSYSLPDAVMDVVHTNLLTTGKGLQKELDVVASIVNVALDCCAESPARRTNMKDVVGKLQKIKIQLFPC